MRVGLIGASPDVSKSWGARAHIPAIRRVPGYDLVAVCTSTEATAAAAAAHFSVPLAFADAGKMATDPSVDMVVIAVNVRKHRDLVLAVLPAGKPIYCEWPLGVTTAEARELQVASEAANVATAIGLQARGNPALRYVRDLIGDGYIGKVLSVDLQVRQQYYGAIEAPEQCYIATRGSGAELLRIAGAHAMDGLSYCLGEMEEVRSVAARQYPLVRLAGTTEVIEKSVNDHWVIGIKFESGVIGSLHLVGGASRTAGIRLEINGTKGDLLLTSVGGAGLQRATLALQGGQLGKLEPMPMPLSYGKPPLDPDDPTIAIARVYEEIIIARRVGEWIPNDFAHAVRRHELIDAVEAAATLPGVRVC